MTMYLATRKRTCDNHNVNTYITVNTAEKHKLQINTHDGTCFAYHKYIHKYNSMLCITSHKSYYM